MPILLVGGLAQGSRKPEDSGPCEWCGVPLAARPNPLTRKLNRDESRYFTQSPCVDEDHYEPTSVILTRLCVTCIHIAGVMGDAGIREMPDDVKSL